MKTLKALTAAILAIAFLSAPVASFAETKADTKTEKTDKKEKKAKAKAYPLKTCVVSDEEIGKDKDMKPYVFVKDGQEVKLCCSSCKKDFDKEPEKYMKKIADAAKKPAK